MTAPLPPVGVDHLVAWLREHRGAFTEEALRGRLLEAGHPPADVEAAFTRLHADEASAAPGEAPQPGSAPGLGAASPGPPGPGGTPAPAFAAEVTRQRDAVLAFLTAFAAILGIPAILVAAGAPGFAVPVAFAALLLALVGWGVSRDGEHPGVATGLRAALIVAVLTPVIAVIALFGYCVFGGGRVI